MSYALSIIVTLCDVRSCDLVIFLISIYVYVGVWVGVGGWIDVF